MVTALQFLVAAHFLWIISFYSGQAVSSCTDGDTQGSSVTHRSHVTGVSGHAYVASSSGAYEFTCAGHLKQFHFHCHKNGEVRFQVWRPSGGTTYTLIAEHTETVTGCEDASITLILNPTNSSYSDDRADLGLWADQANAIDIRGNQLWRLYSESGFVGSFVDHNPGDTLHPSLVNNMRSLRRLGGDRLVTLVHGADSLPVQPGDVLGIWQNPVGVIVFDEYGAGSAACCQMRYADLTASVGNLYTLSAATVRRAYSVEMTLAEQFDPVIVNLPETVEIYEDAPVETWVFSVQVKDKEVWASSQKLTFYLQDAFFKIDANTGEISLKSSLDYEVQTSHALSAVVGDGVTNVTDILNVDVIDVDEDFDVTNLPKDVTINVKTFDCATNVFTALTSSSHKVACHKLSLSPHDGTFSVSDDPTNDKICQVKCSGSLENLQVETYILTMAVVSANGWFSSGPLNLTIHLTNLNTPPSFSNLPTVIRVPETHDGGAVDKLIATDADGDTFNFTLLSVNPANFADLFTVDANSGDVYLAASTLYDFETGQHHFELLFTVADHLGSSEPEALSIYIYDVNEPPVCNPSTYRLTIPEKLPRDTRLAVTFDATDPDLHDVVTFTLQPGRETRYFLATGQQLYVAEPIDLGTGPNEIHNFTVQGIDKGGLTCSAEVIINVTQVNDPHDITNLPNVLILNAQTAHVGLSVLNVTVFPIENADVFTYSIVSISPSDGSFHLDPVTGEVTLVRTLRYTSESMYNLTVSVTDRDGFTAGPATLLMYVTDIKRPPYIHNLPYTETITEDVMTSQLIIKIDGRDLDGDVITRYNLIHVSPPSANSIFLIDSATGDVSYIANPGFDYETTSTYTLTCTVEDAFHTSEARNLTVLITDVNEAPQSPVTAYTAQLYEETPIGTIISLGPHDLEAHDPDAGDTVTFHLKSSTYSNLFTMVGNQLTVSSRIDSEAGVPNGVTVEIVTSDNSGLAGPDLTVTLTVIDINDHAPFFTSDVYRGTVQENSYGGTYILTVTASDGDASPPNTDFHYYINDTYSVFNEGQTFFMVDAFNGDIRVKHQIDFDRFPYVEFEVLAIDEGEYPSQMTGSATVIITVADINDEGPSFNEEFISMEVSSGEDPGYLIATLNATDADSHITSNISYSYLRYSPYFELSGKSGEIAIKRELKGNTKYVLYCLATDNGDPEHVSNVAIVRIDSFKPEDYLIDMELSLPLVDFDEKEERFLTSLRDVINPWFPRIHHVYGQQDFSGKRKLLATAQDTKTIVTLYALENLRGEQLQHLTENKALVHRDQLLAELRTNINGDPSKELQSSDFAEFLVVKVSPTHPIWWTDTKEGITTVTLLSLLAAVIIVVIIVCCCRNNPYCNCDKFNALSFRICCRQRRPITPEKPPPNDPMEPEFSLRYKQPEANSGSNYEFSTREEPSVSKQPKGGHNEQEKGFLVGMLNNRKQRRVSTPPGDKDNTSQRKPPMQFPSHSNVNDPTSSSRHPSSEVANDLSSNEVNDPSPHQGGDGSWKRSIRPPIMTKKH